MEFLYKAAYSPSPFNTAAGTVKLRFVPLTISDAHFLYLLFLFLFVILKYKILIFAVLEFPTPLFENCCLV